MDDVSFPSGWLATVLLLSDVVLVRDGASGPLDDVSRLSIVDVGSTFFVLVVSE